MNKKRTTRGYVRERCRPYLTPIPLVYLRAAENTPFSRQAKEPKKNLELHTSTWHLGRGGMARWGGQAGSLHGAANLSLPARGAGSSGVKGQKAFPLHLSPPPSPPPRPPPHPPVRGAGPPFTSLRASPTLQYKPSPRYARAAGMPMPPRHEGTHARTIGTAETPSPAREKLVEVIDSPELSLSMMRKMASRLDLLRYRVSATVPVSWRIRHGVSVWSA